MKADCKRKRKAVDWTVMKIQMIVLVLLIIFMRATVRTLVFKTSCTDFKF